MVTENFHHELCRVITNMLKTLQQVLLSSNEIKEIDGHTNGRESAVTDMSVATFEILLVLSEASGDARILAVIADFEG